MQIYALGTNSCYHYNKTTHQKLKPPHERNKTSSTKRSCSPTKKVEPESDQTSIQLPVYKNTESQGKCYIKIWDCNPQTRLEETVE